MAGDSEFEKCPFCNADSDQITKSPSHIITKWVYCTQCGAGTESSPNENWEAATRKWNTRPQSSRAGIGALGEWQPIESAPRNGVHIMVAMPVGEHGEKFYVQRLVWYNEGEGWLYVINDTKPIPVEIEPTHWMPLPPAPITTTPDTESE